MGTTNHRPDPLDELEHDHHPARLADAMSSAWQRGWQPLDLSRVLGTHDRLASALFVDALTVDRGTWHPRAAPVWTEHAETIGASREPWWDVGQSYWRQFLERHACTVDDAFRAVALTGFLTRTLPEQPRLEPAPTEPGLRLGAAVDEGVLAKVRGLLAKAESTTFDGEAQALAAKAQQLITRHSIDLAMLAADVDVPGGRRMYLERPYTKAKFVLLDAIADANTCRCVWNARRETATLIGHQADMHLTEMLFTSLLLQGTAVVVEAGAQHDIFGRSSTTSWRNAFWLGFAHRVGERLREARSSARTDALAEAGDRLVPVLAARSDRVDAAFEEAFPNLGTIDVSLSNGDGLRAGRSAADTAELTAERAVQGRRRSLPA